MGSARNPRQKLLTQCHGNSSLLISSSLGMIGDHVQNDQILIQRFTVRTYKKDVTRCRLEGCVMRIITLCRQSTYARLESRPCVCTCLFLLCLKIGDVFVECTNITSSHDAFSPPFLLPPLSYIFIPFPPPLLSLILSYIAYLSPPLPIPRFLSPINVAFAILYIC